MPLSFAGCDTRVKPPSCGVAATGRGSLRTWRAALDFGSTVMREPAGIASVAGPSVLWAEAALGFSAGSTAASGAIGESAALPCCGSQPARAATPVRLSAVTEAAATMIIGWVLRGVVIWGASLHG